MNIVGSKVNPHIPIQLSLWSLTVLMVNVESDMNAAPKIKRIANMTLFK